MNSTLPVDPLDNVNNEENSTTSDHVVQHPTGLSVENVQRIANAMAALVGHPSSSNKPWYPDLQKSLTYLLQVRNLFIVWYIVGATLNPPCYPVQHG